MIISAPLQRSLASLASSVSLRAMKQQKMTGYDTQLCGICALECATTLVVILLKLPCNLLFLVSLLIMLPKQKQLQESHSRRKCLWYGQVLKIGNAWALLGSLRLYLVLPPRGLDPSGKLALKMEHTRQDIQKNIQPELWAREAVQHLPGGWDETSQIMSLRTEQDQKQTLADELDSKRVLRPVPSQYRQLQRELQRFLDGMGGFAVLCTKAFYCS